MLSLHDGSGGAGQRQQSLAVGFVHADTKAVKKRSAKGDEADGKMNPLLLQERMVTLWDKLRNLGMAECQIVKMKGGIPVARNAPMKTFGFNSYDYAKQKLEVKNGLPLSIVNGHLVPIQVGSRDYLIQGTIGELLEFLDCFFLYRIIGSWLREDGTWDHHKTTKHPLYLQLQNTGPQAFGLIPKVLLERAGKSIIKRLNPYDNLGSVLENVYSGLKFLSTAGKRLSKYLNEDKSYVKELRHFIQVYQDAELIWKETGKSGRGDLTSRAKKLLKLLGESERFSEWGKWTGIENVNLNRRLLLTITMYPQQENGVRATRRLSSNHSSVGEVFFCISGLLMKSGTKLIEKLNNAANKE